MTDTTPTPAPVDNQRVISPELYQKTLAHMRTKQNLPAAAFAALVAALVGASAWALITAVTEYQIGFMAIGIGFLVGVAVRTVGKGVDPVFNIVGAIGSLFGCALGNLLTVVYFAAKNEGLSFVEVLPLLTPEIIVNLMSATFSVMDVVFYAIAVYFGYAYSIRPVTEADVAAAILVRG